MKFKTLYINYSRQNIKDVTRPTPVSMFADYLREVLLFRQGPKICEDAITLFQIPIPQEGDFHVLRWDEFLRYCIASGDYVFKKDYKAEFLRSIDAHLAMLEYLKPVFQGDEVNAAIHNRQELTLRIVKAAILDAVPDENLFVERWSAISHAPCVLPRLNRSHARRLRAGITGPRHDSAWLFFVARLAECLAKACAIRAGEHGASDEAAASELGSLLADVICVNHYKFAGEA